MTEDYSMILEIMLLGTPNVNYFRVTLYGHL